jgi:DNA sulfur modification protein DndD
MIIKELRLNNFLVFPGEHRLQFPTEADSNLVVILAPNNTGKTSVIRALKFLFYGHLSDCGVPTAYRMINDRACSQAKIGSELSGYVEITLDLDGEDLCFRRTITTRKSGKDQWAHTDIALCRVVRQTAKILVTPDDDGLLQTKLDTLVPETLFDAFYFKGEPLDGKLLGGVNAIRESLASFLHEDRWEEAEQAAESIRQQYTRELEKLTEHNTGYNKLLRDEELFRNHMLKEQERLNTAKRELDHATAQFEETTSQLQELGSAAEGERLVAQMREHRSALDRAKKNRERADSDIARLVGTSRGIPFLLGALPTARRILKEMQDENILPADISEPFVHRVLKANKCVCGRDHTEDTRAAWIRYKDKTLSVDLNRGLSDLLSAVQDDTSQSYVRFSQDTATKLKNLRDERTRLIEEIQRLETAVSETEKKLEHSPIEAIKQLGQRLRELSATRQRLQSTVTSLEDAIALMQKNLKKLKDEMDRSRPSGAIAQKERVLQKARTRAEKLRLLIRESREVLSRSFHQLLQESVAEYYDNAAYDGSKARINRATLLPAIESNGQVHGNLGGGQSQLLALAYIVSLARLRKSLHAQMQQLGIGLGKLDDQSFFLDSPFNHMTDHYAHAIARFLEGNARQVVLLLARHQWNLVKEILEPSANRVFAFQYHTLADKVAELKKKDAHLEDFVYEFGGNKMKLINELPDDEEHPYTTIKQVT